MPKQPNVRRRPLTRDPGFLRLWAAETISSLGSSITGIALPLVAITTLAARPFEVAILNLADFLPFLLFGLIAGAAVDRLPRRGVLIVGDLGRAALLLVIPVAYFTNWLSIPLLICTGFLAGILTVFFDVAYQSYLPTLIHKEDLVEGNSKMEISRSAAGLVGPTLAGTLVTIIAAPIAVLFDAASFIFSALFVFSIRQHEPERTKRRTAAAARVPRESFRSEIAAGVRFVFGNPLLRSIGGATATSNLFATAGTTLILLFAVRELHLTPALVGLSFTLAGGGGLLAALVAGRISKRLGVGRTIFFMIPLGGPMLVLVAFAQPGADLLNMALFALEGFFAVASGTIYNINQVSLRQAITPEPMQGRMNATMRWFVWGTIPIGALLGGLIGETLGLRAAIVIGGVGASFAFVPLLFGPVRSIVTMPKGPSR